MLTGSKWYSNGGYYHIKVHGYPGRSYLYFSKREAEKEYREAYGLKGKRIKWYED